jgi:ectoine hydroxylase-related dioxygenase (phytanoyl-CoA dioxygenase family)
VTTKRIVEDGYCVIAGVLDACTVTRLADCVSTADFAKSLRGDDAYGARNILSEHSISSLACSGEISSLLEELTCERCDVVRGIFFDKTPGANWPVAWHQDLTLAVAQRREVPGWINWSVKAGVNHVQPPPEILDRMVTLRLHLDDCGADNGPLRVLPGTHRMGRLTAERIKLLRSEIVEATCCAPSGSVLAMKPLLLHASSAARAPRHRRVIHLEFAPRDLLPSGLEWAFTSPASP